MRAIVNVNEEWGIGCGGNLLVNIPDDMKFFRRTTAGSIVIMGRKTLESFPESRPLKGRVNIVLTGDSSRISEESRQAADVWIDGLDTSEGRERFKELAKGVLASKDAPVSERATVLAVLYSSEEAVDICTDFDADSVFVIGGASIYEEMLPYCDSCMVTINDSKNKADTFFPDLDKLPDWEHAETGNIEEYEGIHYHFDTFRRVGKNV